MIKLILNGSERKFFLCSLDGYRGDPRKIGDSIYFRDGLPGLYPSSPTWFMDPWSAILTAEAQGFEVECETDRLNWPMKWKDYQRPDRRTINIKQLVEAYAALRANLYGSVTGDTEAELEFYRKYPPAHEIDLSVHVVSVPHYGVFDGENNVVGIFTNPMDAEVYATKYKGIRCYASVERMRLDSWLSLPIESKEE